MHILSKLNPRNWIKRSSFWREETKLDTWNTAPSQTIAYRLKKWPDLHAELKSVGSYRALSLLSHEPVCLQRLANCMQGNLTQTINFLKHLDKQDALEIVDMEWKVSQKTLAESLRGIWEK